MCIRDRFAPFLSRISAIAKYSRKLVMNCMTQTLGRLYLQWLEKVGGSLRLCLLLYGVVHCCEPLKGRTGGPNPVKDCNDLTEDVVGATCTIP